MEQQNKPPPPLEAQGVVLIDLVIERVRADPACIFGFPEEPHPIPADLLEHLTFPSGKPLPPSLKRWLAFDASWLAALGWFASSASTVFTPHDFGDLVTDEFGEMWGKMWTPLSTRMGECFLLPDGSDSRRILAVTKPDALGEYPVIVIDMDDTPYTAVKYPGFDVYMADHAGMGISAWPHYQALSEDPRYQARIQQHADHLFKGKVGIEMWDEESCTPASKAGAYEERSRSS
jgi:hypothetical protein